MSYEEFLEKIREDIQRYLPVEYASNEAQIVKRMINNGAFYYGLSVRRQGSNVAPLLNLKSYYEDYMRGHTLVDTLRDIAATYYHLDIRTPALSVEDFLYENIKDKIFVAICNADLNREELANAPHELKEDLALRYYIRYECSDNEVGTIRIRNEHLKLWNISPEELKKQAWKNMKCVLKPTLQTLKQIAMGSLRIPNEDMRSYADEVYVLTSEKQTCGAAYLFDDFVMRSIATILDDDLLILPSSVDEVLLVRRNSDEGGISVSHLKEIVEEVNRSCVEPEEFLSDEVYLYEKGTHQLSIANDGEQQMDMSMNM